MATNYLRKGIRNPTTYVWVNKRAELSRQSQQNDLSSHSGLRREKPVLRATKTAHDIINEYREQGLHMIDLK